MKKMLSLAIALLMALGMTAFAVPDQGTYPLVDEPAELSITLGADERIEDMATNETTLWYEAKTGVHINWTEASGDGWKTLSLASHEYPDIYSCSFSTDEIMQYGVKAHVMIPLEDLIEEYAPNLRAVLEERPDIREAITAPDGHIYTLFRTDPATYTLVRNKLYVMHDWLEKYVADGNESPSTWEELEDMLIYFRDNDMNGNGDPNDEIPMMGTMGTSGGDFTTYLLNAFTAVPENNFVMATKEGEVYCVANTEAYREGLKWIHHLFEEGLIAEETFIQDNNQLKSLVNKNDPAERIVGCFGGFWAGVTVSPASMDNAYDIYDPLVPIEGPEGEVNATTSGHLDLFLVGCITSACENPELAIRWLDFWMSEEGMIMIDYGFEGVNWEWNDTPAINGNTPSRYFLTSRNVLQNTTWYVGTVPYYRTEESLFGRTPTDHVPYLYEGADVYDDYYTLTNFPAVAWCSDVELIAEYNELKTLFNEYLQKAKVQFITGALDIEDDGTWNEYLAKLEEMGIEHYLDVIEQINFG